MKYTYKTSGCCATDINFEVEGDTIQNVEFIKGCKGNTEGLIYLSVAVPIPCSFYHNCSVVQLEVRHGDSTRGYFILEKSFCYPRFLLFQMNLQIALSNSLNELGF